MEVMNNQFLNTGEVTVKIEDSQRYSDFLSVNSHQQNLDFLQTASCAMNYGNVSPGSEYGVYNSNSSNGNDSCMSPPYIFSSVQDTLNNYGVSAYSTDYDRSFNSTLDTSLNTTLGDSPPYPSHITPSSTPAPSDLELPPEEPSLQLMENLSLQNLSPMHSNSYTGLQDNLQNSNSYFMNSSMSSSPAPSVQSSVSPFPSYNYDTNLQLPSTSQYNPQFQSYGNNSEVFDPITVLDSINENDLLNIQGEYNIDQIISSEGLGNDKNGPSSLGSSPRLPNDPFLWKKADVRSWINWAKIQFSLSDRISPDMLPATGKELCKLSRQQIQQRVGDDAGKQLAEYLEYLLNKFGKSLPEMKANIDPYELYREACSRLCLPGSSQIQLWQFLLELLITREHSNIITWENTNSEFKILDPDGVATLWGIRKSKPNMNYDKLSRALRYYYDRNLMYKVAGKRYAYKVSFPNLELLHAAQHGSEPRPQPDLALFSAINNSRSPPKSSSSPKMC